MIGFIAPETRPLPGPDFAELLELVGDDQVFLGEIIDLFERDASRLVDEIRTSAARLDREAVGRSTHALKGLLSYFGDTVAIDHCRRLESLASIRSTTGAEFEALASSLASEVIQIQKDLARLAPRSE